MTRQWVGSMLWNVQQGAQTRQTAMLLCMSPIQFGPMHPFGSFGRIAGVLAESPRFSGYTVPSGRDGGHTKFSGTFIVCVAPSIGEGFNWQCWHSLGRPRPLVSSICTNFWKAKTLAAFSIYLSFVYLLATFTLLPLANTPPVPITNICVVDTIIMKEHPLQQGLAHCLAR